MVQWVKDTTGRLPKRPHYEQRDIDVQCEQIVTDFLKAKYGKVEYPISTEDLTVLLEQHCADLDQYADLAEEEEGLTEFYSGKQPSVKIARRLSENPSLSNRLRTTLTHELGHIILQGFIFSAPGNTGSLFGKKRELKSVCKRENMLTAGQTDWMEWQAGYACGAFLMPLSHLKEVIQGIADKAQAVARVQQAYQVSGDAARVRLSKLGFLGISPGISLFS